MIDVSFTYSEEDNAWVSEELSLTGDIVLCVSMKAKGLVVITAFDGKEWPKAYVSPKSVDDTEINIYGDTDGGKIRVYTSEEPKNIRYANI